jgi:hypothetical protein
MPHRPYRGSKATPGQRGGRPHRPTGAGLTGLQGQASQAYRRRPHRPTGAGLTGLTSLTGVRRSVHLVGMQGRVRRSVGRAGAHAQGRFVEQAVHCKAMQAQGRSVGRLGAPSDG